MPNGQTVMTNLFFTCYNMHYAVGCPAILYIDYYGGEAVNHITRYSTRLYFVLSYTAHSTLQHRVCVLDHTSALRCILYSRYFSRGNIFHGFSG